MKSIIALFLILFHTVGLSAQAQNTSKQITAYQKFKPATVKLMDGKTLTVPLANVFLKGSKLVYKSSNGKVMQAKMSNVKTVDFDDRHYERIDTMLAWRVDTVGKNALYCVSIIDLKSLKRNLVNSRNMTNIDFGSDVLSIATLDIDPETIDYPLINVYYYIYNNKIIPVHEREITHHIPRDKQYDFEVATSLSTFSWTDASSLMDLLRRVSK